MATVDSTIDQIISRAQTTADNQLSEMNAKIDEAINISQGRAIGDFPESLSPSAPTTLALEAPTLTLEDLVDLEDPKSLKIKEDIDREFQGFLNDYFPDFKDNSAKLMDWIWDTIDNGGKALPADEEGKIWDRARSREDALNEKTTHEATEMMARKGWGAPPGALAERLRVAQQENTVRQSTLSRDIAIEQARLAHEMLRFAVTQAVAVQQNALNAAAQFVSEYVRASAIGLESSASLANAAVNLYNQTIAYYRASFEQEDLKRRFAEGNVDAELRGKITEFQEKTRSIQTSAQTAVEAARALGDSAAAALGAQNTIAGTIQEITEESS